MSSLLAVSGLSVSTEGPHARVLVDEVSFTLAPGQVLTLLGESGSGKSLLAQAVMGTLPPGLRARGSVALEGVPSPAGAPAARRKAWGRRLTLLPQEPWSALDPTMRAHAQVAESYRCVRGLSTRESANRATQALAALGLADAAGRFPFMLSGGMAQRVAFAATAAAGAPVLIVDEPTKGLDTALRDQIVGLLQGLLAGGGAALVITHDVAVPRALGGRVAVMRDAQIVEQGPAASVLQAPTQAYTRALLAAEPACWPARPAAPVRVAEAAVPLVQASGLKHAYGPRPLFEGVDLQLHAGERVAILGRSGSGKTTLGNLMLGLVQPQAGRVTRAAGLGAHAFQKLYQDPLAAFAPHLPLRTAMHDLMALHRLPMATLAALLERLGLNDALLDRRPAQVSGGELQRMALARVLLLQPAMVFADEPTSRLDPITQQQTLALLTSTLEERGGALLLVTHDPALARHVCARCIEVGPPQLAG